MVGANGLELEKAELSAGKPLKLRVTVEKTGPYSGDEVVQCYLRDEEASVAVPRWSLCTFARVHLAAGESREISLTVRPESMNTVLEDGSRVIEPGMFTLYVGGSQPDEKSVELTGKRPLQASFQVK